MAADRTLQGGFSLIEVVVFISIIAVVFVAAVSYATNSLYRMRLSEHKTKAIFYSEELKEWLEGEHEADWIAFSSKAGTTYCVNNELTLDTSISSLSSGGTCNMNGISGDGPQIYRRRVQLTSNTPTQVTAHITVDWNETAANGTIVPFTQTLDTIFTSY